MEELTSQIQVIYMSRAKNRTSYFPPCYPFFNSAQVCKTQTSGGRSEKLRDAPTYTSVVIKVEESALKNKTSSARCNSHRRFYVFYRWGMEMERGTDVVPLCHSRR